MRRQKVDGFVYEAGNTGPDSGGHVIGTENRQQSMDSPEMEEWRKARRKWKCKVARPNDKLVVGNKMPYKKKIRQDGEVEKYKCRLVDYRLWKVEEVHHIDAEHAFLKANSDEEVCIKIPQEHQEFPGAVGLLNRMIDGLVQVGRCWNSKFCDDRTTIGFEQSKADTCVFRKVDDGKVEMVVIVHVDDILAQVKDQAMMERFTAELEKKFKLKDMGGTSFFRSVNPFKNGRAAKSRREGGHVKVSTPRSNRGAHEDGNEYTAGHCVRGTRCDQIQRKTWTGV